MKGLNRTLGLPMLIFYGTGMILGAGIYSIIGKAAAKTGDTLWLGFALAGLSAILTALSYAELSAMFPKAGAEFVYLQQAFKKKKWIGSVAGIAMAFAGAATAATVALSFAGYFNQFFQSPHTLVALAVLLVFSGIAIIGIRTSGWFTVVSTLIEVGGLVFIIYLGMTSESFGNSLETTPHLGTLSGSALIIFSFFGFENIANLAEETKDLEKNQPRAILISVIIATRLYVLVSISVLALLTPEKLAQSDAPLMSVARAVSENYGRILGASRIIYGMGEAKTLPAMTSSVLPKRKTPWLASLIVLVLASLLLSLGELGIVGSISSFTTMVAFFLVNVALITLRYTQSSTKRPFRVPLNIGKLPILPILAALITLALLSQLEAKVYLIGGSFMAASTLGFWWYERRH
jgi:APA family basic amino acid/polyamine antiporter